MTKKELIERLQELVSKYKDEAEWGSMFASSTYSIVADDLESLIKEIKTGDLIISDDEIGDGSYEKYYHA